MPTDIDPNDDSSFEPVADFFGENDLGPELNSLENDFPAITPLADKTRFIEPKQIADNSGQVQEEEEEQQEEFTLDFLDKVVDEEEKAELIELNRKLGTNFNSMEELRNSLRKEDSAPQDQEYQVAKNNLSILEDAVNNYSDLRLLVEHKKFKERQAGRIMSASDVEEYELNLTMQQDRDSDAFEDRAMGIRQLYRNQLLENKAIVDKHENHRKLTKEQAETQRKQAFQKAIIDFSNQEDFYGMKLTKQDYINAYNSVTKNKLIEHIRSNPNVAIELQLLLNKREDLKKVAGSATYSEGVKATINAINGQRPDQVQTVRNDKRKLSDMDNFITDFVR